MEPTIQKMNIPVPNIKMFGFWMAFVFPSSDLEPPLYIERWLYLINNGRRQSGHSQQVNGRGIELIFLGPLQTLGRDQIIFVRLEKLDLAHTALKFGFTTEKKEHVNLSKNKKSVWTLTELKLPILLQSPFDLSIIYFAQIILQKYSLSPYSSG